MKITSLIVLALLGINSACAYSQNTITKESEDDADIVEIPHLGSSAILNDKELKRVTALAEAGDPEANYRLFAHYGIGLDDPIADKYFDRAVELGYPPAMYSKAVHMWDTHDPDKSRIRDLVQRAVKAGYPDTQGFLNKLDEKQSVDNANQDKIDTSN